MAYRWFLRMGLTEKVPDASTLSQNRLRRFNHSDVFQQIFDHIVGQALERGMANGRVLYTDSTHLKADANPRKAVNELRPEGVSEYLAQLNAAVEADRKKHEKKPLPGIKKTPESAVAVKNTKVSTTDPQSGFMHRDNKPKGFFYLDHRTVDGKHGIIMDTHVTPGNVHDSQPFIGRLERQIRRFGLEPVAVGVNAGYFTSAVCHLTQERGIALVPGYRRPQRLPALPLSLRSLSAMRAATEVHPERKGTEDDNSACVGGLERGCECVAADEVGQKDICASQGNGGEKLRGCKTASWTSIRAVPWSVESADAVPAGSDSAEYEEAWRCWRFFIVFMRG